MGESAFLLATLNGETGNHTREEEKGRNGAESNDGALAAALRP
jgi:hypothetical protein